MAVPADYVRTARVPESGRHPRLALGPEELVLLYFRGEDAGGDLVFTRSGDEGATFAPGVRLNPTPGTVSVSGAVSPGAVTLGPDGRAHVAWVSSEDPPHLYYAHEGAEGELGAALDLGTPLGLGTNAGLLVDPEGKVFLYYPAADLEESDDELAHGRIWLRQSADGTSFSEPRAIDREEDGVSTRSEIDAHLDAVRGTHFVLYRCATVAKPGHPAVNRPLRLLSSEDHGITFDSSRADNHRQQRDPEARAVLTQDKDTTLACWEAGGLVCWSLIRRNLNRTNLPVEPKDTRVVVRTAPTVAAGAQDILMAWLEQPKADREAPKQLAWQLWLREGRQTQGAGLFPETIENSTPVAFARRTGGFTILY